MNKLIKLGGIRTLINVRSNFDKDRRTKSGKRFSKATKDWILTAIHVDFDEVNSFNPGSETKSIGCHSDGLGERLSFAEVNLVKIVTPIADRPTGRNGGGRIFRLVPDEKDLHH